MTDIAEKTHALLSPSGAHRWTRCPGSVVLEQSVPNKSSPHARWGTVAHEVGAMVLAEAVRVNPVGDGVEQWAPANAESFVGRIFTVEGHEIEFDMEMADCVNDYVAHVESFWEPGDILLVEQAVPLSHITGEEGAEGTSDCIIIKVRARELVVIDLKGGRGVQVYADDENGTLNEQGAMYADGALYEHDMIHGPFERIRIVIVQPRLQHVSEVAASPEELAVDIGLINHAAHVARVAQDCDADPKKMGEDSWPDQFLSPGEKQCRFCNAKAICPALEGAVSEALSMTAPPARADEFPDLSLAKQASAAVPSGLGSVEGERLAKAWKAIPLVEQWAGAIREMVHELLHDDQPVGDLCLYEGQQGSRTWSNAAEAEALMKKSRAKVDEMYTKKLLTYPAAEKAFKGKPLWAKLAPLVDRAPPKPVVGVQGDANRTVWSPAKAEEFPDLSAEDDVYG